MNTRVDLPLFRCGPYVRYVSAPLARNADPISSFEAAEELVESGTLKTQEQEVLAALKLHPSLSSKCLAKVSGLNRYTVARRLPGLRDKDKAQNCPAKSCYLPCDRNDYLCREAQLCMVAVIGERHKPLRWWPRKETDNS